MNKDFQGAVEQVRRGGLVAFPTDTVYGIGCDPYNADAIDKLYAAKQRPSEKHIPVLVSSIETAREVGVLSNATEELVVTHWPGALTIVVPQRVQFPANLSSNGAIALRQPRHKLALTLIEACGGALAVTSANISGEPPARTHAEAARIFEGADVHILDGVAGGQEPSTIVDCTDDSMKVLRQGPIKL